MFSTRHIPLLLVACTYLPAQSSPGFLAVDVHKSPPDARRTLIGIFPGSNRYELHGATMLDLITRAWGVNEDEVVGGPVWLGTQHFELVAIVPNGASNDAVKIMLQKLLGERFGLAVHQETRPAHAFAITLAKTGVKMKNSTGEQEQACQSGRGDKLPAGGVYSTFICKNTTISQFVEWANSRLAGYLGGSSMVDRTGLRDAWDFTLRFLQRNQLAAAGSDGTSFFDAAEKQLGLKINLTKAPQPVLIVDKINETPTATPPEALKLLAGPTKFEFAAIKPSPPDSRPQASTNILPGGRVEIRYSTLQQIIRTAWGIFDDKIVGAPPFATTNHFDITAKAPVKDSTAGLSLSSKEAMLQHLLKDRFKLVTHNEEQMRDVFVLVGSKPKLKAADPANRAGCKMGPSARAIRNRMLTCQNVTMSEFIAELPDLAGAYFDGKPAVDSTGLNGTFDFTLNFSGFTMWQRANAAPGPTDAISLQHAIQQQLGLRLEIQKRPGQVLVIDHLDESPTEN